MQKYKFMLIVRIAGRKGSGKTSVIRKVTKVFPNDEPGLATQDSYYRENIC